jgi:flagellar hook-associated protein 2
MGTVGLNFGSPTSGSGFDVTATVSTIVTNLQKVEQPWKDQLTSLQSQDTAISSLGTLFSALSTDMNSLTDFNGVLAQKTGSSSDQSVLQLTSASSSATAGTHTVVVNNLAQTSSGYLDVVGSASDTLAGTLTIKVNGSTQTFDLSKLTDQTLNGLKTAINTSGLGVTANVLTDASGTRMSLVSNSSGLQGQLTVTSSITDAAAVSGTNPTGALQYNDTMDGKNAALVIDGVPLSSASNTVSNMIPGLTFQLLSNSPAQGTSGALEPVQVIIANDNSGVETAFNKLVTDYNSLLSAISQQEGKDSSGNPEPLFGSPTISLLQQQLMNALNNRNPNGYLDSISASGNTILSGAMTISLANGTSATFQTGTGTAGGGVFYTGSETTLAGLADAINAASANTPVPYSSNSGGNSGAITTSNLSLLSGTAPQLDGYLTLQVGGGMTNTVSMDTVQSAQGGTTLNDIAVYIHANSASLGVDAAVTDNGDGTSSLSLSSLNGDALTVNSSLDIPGLGVTAAVVTNSGQSSLTLSSQSAGPNGAVNVNSNILATTGTQLAAATFTASSTENSSTSFSPIPSGSNSISGSVTIQVGNGGAITVNAPASPGNTLAGIVDAINSTAGIGVTASVTTNSDGSATLSLLSNTAGSAGNLTVTSNLFDMTDTSSKTLNYTNSSDVGSLTQLGISMNNDGTVSFDASTLDALLNTDFSSVLGFFQNANSWGRNFSAMLNGAGISSSTGVLKLASQANSNMESSLNDRIARQEDLIATQKSHLTAELNQANQILQSLPSQLNGIDQLYSAITGYNQKG